MKLIYCNVCGEKLFKYPYIRNYDQVTGEPNKGYILKCPALFSSFRGHTFEYFTEDGKHLPSYSY